MKFFKGKLFGFLSILLVITLFTVTALAVDGESNVLGRRNFEFPRNESGFTYGSILDACSFETEPDLILAIGRCGTEGFVFAKDLYGPQPSTPEEALMLMTTQSRAARSIPLYASDGVTVIGEFIIDPAPEAQLTY